MKFPDSIKLISPYLARVLAVSLALVFLQLFLLQDEYTQFDHEELILVLELDPGAKQSSLTQVEQEIKDFAQENKIEIEVLGRAAAEQLLQEEIPSFSIDESFEQESFITLITLHAKEQGQVLALRAYHQTLSFKNGIEQSSVVEPKQSLSRPTSGYARWVYLIPVLIGVLIYLLLTKLSYHNRLQLRRRERYSIDFMGGDQKKWSLGILKSGMMQSLKLLLFSLVISVMVVLILNYASFSGLGDRLGTLALAAIALILALFFISQWIIHSELKRLNVG